MYFLHTNVRSDIMAKDPIKKADNGTYYFRANLGCNPITGKQIQKYRSGFKTKRKHGRNIQNLSSLPPKN